jgi:hypothetical protein
MDLPLITLLPRIHRGGEQLFLQFALPGAGEVCQNAYDCPLEPDVQDVACSVKQSILR